MTAAIESAIEAEYGEVRAEDDFDRARLANYLRGRIPGAEATALAVWQFRGGHSNLTYLLRFGDSEWVMRRPPHGVLPKSAHDMGREYRVLSRLWQEFAPAPRAILFCDDPAIVGAPFFIMERRRGIVIKKREPLPAVLAESAAARRQVSAAFIDALADLHQVDYERIGLGALGRPAGFFERQVKSWMERWERAKTREVPLMNRLGAWFAANLPREQPPVLLHNDFFLHNVMVAADDPGRMVAVLDWEMSTLGDPMVDVGIALAYWRDRSDPADLLALNPAENHTLREGFMTRAELAERYAQCSGRDLGAIDFYVAWAHWKTATVVEQLYARYARGDTTDERYAVMVNEAPVLARAAAAKVARFGFRD
ncbi:MAG TPA: phosphotransferase family protein [Candidatus Binataceae bacterium]|nr:phosphotransferase family protein [Candidatus Binataceae bacterium]